MFYFNWVVLLWAFQFKLYKKDNKCFHYLIN